MKAPGCLATLDEFGGTHTALSSERKRERERLGLGVCTLQASLRGLGAGQEEVAEDSLACVCLWVTWTSITLG